MKHYDMLLLRPADMEETEKAMVLINDAKAFLHENGIDQWQTGYPDINIIREDITHGRGYFITDGPKTAAYLCIDFKGEPAYEKLNGNWISSLPCAVIHRMAISGAYRGQGIGSIAFRLVEKLCIQKGIYSIRADTDEDNTVMRHVLLKNGFEYCGTIWFDNSVKHAYEKIIK